MAFFFYRIVFIFTTWVTISYLIRLLSIGLLLALSLQFGGYQLLFPVAQKSVRTKAKEKIDAGISDDGLSHFSFCIDSDEYKQLNWTEDDEFRLKGEMYDVVEKTIINGVVNLSCYHDDAETELLEYLDSLIAANAGKLGQSAKKLLDHIKVTVLYIAEGAVLNLYSSFISSANLFLTLKQVHLLPAHLMSVFLPPEL